MDVPKKKGFVCFWEPGRKKVVKGAEEAEQGMREWKERTGATGATGVARQPHPDRAWHSSLVASNS